MIIDLAYSPDGGSVVIGGADEDGGRAFMRVIGSRDPARVRAMDVPKDSWGVIVGFSPDGGEALASWFYQGPEGSGPNWLERYDVRTGRALGRRVDAAEEPLAWKLPFVAGTGELVTVVAQTTVVRHPRTLRQVRTYRGGGRMAALAPDGRRLALGREDGSVALLDLRTGQLRTASGRHAAAVTAMSFTPDGRTLVSAGDDRRLIVWDVDAAAQRETLEGHGGRITEVAIAPDGRTLYSASRDQSVIAWDLAGHRRLGRPFVTGPERPAPDFAVSPDGKSVAVAQADGSVTLIDVESTRRRTGPGEAPAGDVRVTFAPSGKELVVADQQGGLRVWDVRTRRPLTPRVRAHRNIVWPPLMSADGRLMGSASVDGTVRLWRLSGLTPVGAPLRFPIVPSDAALSPDGTLLVVPRQDGLVDVFRTRDLRRRIARFRADRNGVVLGRFAPDGRTFVTGGVDGVVRFWAVPSWKPAGRPLAAHAGYVYSFGFDRAGERLVTGGTDGKVRLWDVATRTPIGTSLPGFANTPVWAAFAAGDRRVVATDPTRGLRWDIRPAAWARRACRVAGRRLSRAEWAEFLPERDYAPAC